MGDEKFLPTSYGLEETAQTLAHYEAWAATYDTEIGEENRYAQPGRCTRALLASGVGPDAWILDVGCGSGLSGVALARAGFTSVDGCDLSPAMLALAVETDAYGTLFEADLNEGLDVADATYDAASAVGVFSFGHIRADALREVLRVIRPGGVVVIGLNDHFWNEGSMSAEFESVEADGLATVTAREHGEHLPAAGIEGWVVTLVKAGGNA
ncbi:MAG: class I SAM-dependent methyltransferase [Actinomycetota bacterium]|nr:class I SAM-dependent methyltransferase [Actinomycetota bacterium]